LITGTGEQVRVSPLSRLLEGQASRALKFLPRDVRNKPKIVMDGKKGRDKTKRQHGPKNGLKGLTIQISAKIERSFFRAQRSKLNGNSRIREKSTQIDS
jgi:hypothetical protein